MTDIRGPSTRRLRVPNIKEIGRSEQPEFVPKVESIFLSKNPMVSSNILLGLSSNSTRPDLKRIRARMNGQEKILRMAIAGETKMEEFLWKYHHVWQGTIKMVLVAIVVFELVINVNIVAREENLVHQHFGPRRTSCNAVAIYHNWYPKEYHTECFSTIQWCQDQKGSCEQAWHYKLKKPRLCWEGKCSNNGWDVGAGWHLLKKGLACILNWSFVILVHQSMYRPFSSWCPLPQKKVTLVGSTLSRDWITLR